MPGSSPRNVNPPGSSLDKHRVTGAPPFTFATTARVLTVREPHDSLGHFNASMTRMIFLERAWDWRPCNESSSGMAGESGRKAPLGKVRHFILGCWMQAGGTLNHGRQDNSIGRRQSR